LDAHRNVNPMPQEIPHDARAEILMGNWKYKSSQADHNYTINFAKISMSSSSSPGRKHPLKLVSSGQKHQRIGSKLRFILVIAEGHRSAHRLHNSAKSRTSSN
jgi:hypothetical protein